MMTLQLFTVYDLALAAWLTLAGVLGIKMAFQFVQSLIYRMRNSDRAFELECKVENLENDLERFRRKARRKRGNVAMHKGLGER